MSRLTEVFIDEEREIAYTCSATWGFLESLKNKHKSLNGIFSSLASGEIEPLYIKDVIECSLTHINNEEVNEAQRKKSAIEIMERFGLQECSLLAREMVSRAMIGDIKKKSLEENLKLKTLMDQLFPSSKLKTFFILGSLWVTSLMSSGLVAYFISK